MSVLVTSLIVAGGVLLGRLIAGGAKNAPTKTDSGAAHETGNPASAAPTDKTAAVTAKADEQESFEDFPCQLGDVVMRRGGDEAWLAGALVLSESRPVAILFVAPEAGKDTVLYVRPRPGTELSWLRAVDAADLTAMPEPPTSIEHEGVRYERRRRIPVRAARIGTGAPDLAGDVIVAEYAAPGDECMVVLVGHGVTRAFAGRRLDEGLYEVIASGKATL